MVNNNSTTFVISEKIGLVLGKFVRKILVISKMHYLVLEKKYLLRLLRHVSKPIAAYVLTL